MCVLILHINPQNIYLKTLKSIDLCYRQVIKTVNIYLHFDAQFANLKMWNYFKFQWLLD